MILPPRALLGIPDQVLPGDVVVMPGLGPTHPGEEAFCPVGVDALLAVSLRVIDPGHVEPGVQRVPRCGLVHHQL